MTFSFSQALEAVAQGCNSAVKGIRERILPTPGKRKREEIAEDAEALQEAPKQQAVQIQVCQTSSACSEKAEKALQKISSRLARILIDHFPGSSNAEASLCEPSLTVCSCCRSPRPQRGVRPSRYTCHSETSLAFSFWLEIKSPPTSEVLCSWASRGRNDPTPQPPNSCSAARPFSLRYHKQERVGACRDRDSRASYKTERGD